MPTYVITGGAGFIGCNTGRRVLEAGHRLVVVDNLSRKGARANLTWLQEHGGLLFEEADVRDAAAMERILGPLGDDDVVIHLAGQVAVTTSVANPREDFEINAGGAVNVLEAVRQSGAKPLLINASTNKVYGGMDKAAVLEHSTRYAYRDLPHGVSEDTPLDFHSPYGCSKGAADQYFHDYSRIYGLPTVVLRQSCIYGPRQFGVEDQGWLAWFAIAAVLGRSVTIYGNGKQVRDVLHVDDLTQAFMLAADSKDKVAGGVYNVGGGPEHTMSVWAEFGPILEELVGCSLDVRFGPWRPGDQPVYVSDIRQIERDLGWRPEVTVRAGIERLVRWVRENRSLFE